MALLGKRGRELLVVESEMSPQAFLHIHCIFSLLHHLPCRIVGMCHPGVWEVWKPRLGMRRAAWSRRDYRWREERMRVMTVVVIVSAMRIEF